MSSSFERLNLPLGEMRLDLLNRADGGQKAARVTAEIVPPSGSSERKEAPYCSITRMYDSSAGLAGCARLSRQFLSDANESLPYNLRLAIALGVAAGFLPVHASGIALGARAILFVGPSGAGKSTVAQGFFDDCPLIHDDRVFIDPGPPGGSPVVLGSPLLEPGRKPGTPDTLPLQAIIVLEQASSTHLDAVSPARLVGPLLSSLPPWLQVARHQLLELSARVAASTACFKLQFQLDRSKVRSLIGERFGRT